MTVRSCTCGAATRSEIGITLVAGVDGHFRDCVSLLPDPDTCLHRGGVKREGEVYCGACGKGLSEGARAWYTDKLRPGYAEEVAAQRAVRQAEAEVTRARENTYDLSGIYLDEGITDLSDQDLSTLIDCCTREQNYRASATPQAAST